MNRQAFDPATFTSRMTKGELIAVLLYLPLHVWLLPLLLYSLPAASGISELQINLIVYVAGALYMLLFAGRFLRRDFDPLCDHFRYCLLQVLISYCMMIGFNLILNSILLLVLPSESANPNNAAVMEMAGVEYGKTAALAIFLAPLVEEPVFRGAACCSSRSIMSGAMPCRTRSTGSTCCSICRSPGCFAAAMSAATASGAASSST